MKTSLILFPALCLIFFSFSTVAKTKNKESLKFQIKKLDTPISFNGNNLKTWILTYDGEQFPALVGIEKRGHDKYLHVRYGFLQICYIDTNGNFGVSQENTKFTTTDPDIYMAIINLEKFKKQNHIQKKGKSIRSLLKTIAYQIPELHPDFKFTPPNLAHN